MTHFAPLPLRLVEPAWADRVPSPAHDSLTPDQRRQFLVDNPDSYLTVTRSPEDIAPTEPPASSEELLQQGRVALDRLVAGGAFSEEHPSRFYVYRLEMGGHRQTGVVGGVSLDDYETGELRVHEQVQGDRTRHLAQHLAVVEAQSSPIAITHRPDRRIEMILERVTLEDPIVRAAGSDGLLQTVWPVLSQADEDAIMTAFADHSTYIIDGHHRAAAGLDHHKSVGSDKSGQILVAAFSSDQLLNRAFHRRLTDLSIDAFIRAIDTLSWRELTRASADQLEDDEVLIYGGGRWLAVDLPHDPAGTLVANLDPVRIEQQILRGLLQLEPTNSAGELRYLPGTTSIGLLAAEVDQIGGVLCISRPVPVDLLLDAADQGLIMPPKSTYFEPKVRSGIFVRSTVEA